MNQSQEFVALVRDGLSFIEALAQSTIAGKGSFGGHKFYYMEDGSRVWRAIRHYPGRGPMVPIMSACCAPPSNGPRPANYRTWTPSEAEPQ